MSITLIEPHGGCLVNLLADSSDFSALKDESNEYPSWTLTDRQICDLELLLNGAFSPLNGFMIKNDYESVLGNFALRLRKIHYEDGEIVVLLK